MTGGHGLLVRHAALEQVSTDLRLAVQAIGERLARLDAELAGLRAEFDGQARAGYDAAKVRWDGAVADLRQLLADTGVQVGQANAGFAEADRSAAARMGQVF